MGRAGWRKEPLSREGSADLTLKPKLVSYYVCFVCVNAYPINRFQLIYQLRVGVSGPWLHKPLLRIF